jgi:hypothetical protein
LMVKCSSAGKRELRVADEDRQAKDMNRRTPEHSITKAAGRLKVSMESSRYPGRLSSNQ